MSCFESVNEIEKMESYCQTLNLFWIPHYSKSLTAPAILGNEIKSCISSNNTEWFSTEIGIKNLNKQNFNMCTLIIRAEKMDM